VRDRWWVSASVVTLILALSMNVSAQALGKQGASSSACEPDWPLWRAFVARFVQADGRVLESSMTEKHSSSEGQSYAMFFALVANDRDKFETLWQWSKANLAGNDVRQRLPAWHWGLRADGTWGVSDPNSASDADLWFAYSLLEAGDRWQRLDYLEDARKLIARIESDEVVELPGLGKMLLPGFTSFVRPDNLWRLNPSYLPLPVLRRLELASPQGPWNAIATNSVAMMKAVSPRGMAADWVAYRGTSPQSGLFVIDPVNGDKGSYDAIRTYLWAGLTSKDDPLAQSLVEALHGMSAATAVSGAPPEIIHASTGVMQGSGPPGFAAALSPYFQAKGEPWLAELQTRRVAELIEQSVQPEANKGRPPLYYDVVLTLFGSGWTERRYRFASTGRVQLPQEKECPRATTR
jgi:endoglucanase